MPYNAPTTPSVIKVRTYEQGGSVKISLNPEWRHANGIRGKTDLDVVISTGMLILPPYELSDNEIDEMLGDMKLLIKMMYRNKQVYQQVNNDVGKK